MKTTTRVSQKKIAEELGVSTMTVSRVLGGNNGGVVAEATSQRIIQAAKRAMYRPNLLVRGMQTGKTHTVGVIIPSREYDYKILSGVHDELINANHIPYVIWDASDAIDKSIDANELKQIHRLIDRRVDGIILKPTDESVTDEYLREIWERDLPLVVVDREMTHTHANFVGTEDYKAAQLVASCLLELGHKHFAHLTVRSDVITLQLRRDGFVAKIAEHKNTSCDIIEGKDVNDPAMESYVERLLTKTPRPTAIFVPIDTIAIAVYSVARKLKINIPDELSVFGFANLQLCEALYPSLASVEQFPYKIGRTAAKLLLQCSNRNIPKSKPQRIRIEPELIIRNSITYCSKF